MTTNASASRWTTRKFRQFLDIGALPAFYAFVAAYTVLVAALIAAA